MQLIGLAGPARVGKDSIADVLVTQFGFTQFSFSDALYKEVSEAFGVRVEELQFAESKEAPSPLLAIDLSTDVNFISAMASIDEDLDEPRSPRWILQRWGTDYRRKQQADYWIQKADEWLANFQKRERLNFAQALIENDTGYEGSPGVVNTSVRFENEREWIKECGGEVWHVVRRARLPHLETAGYASELGLEPETGDKIFYNHGTIEAIGAATQLLLGGNAVVNTRGS